MNRTPPTNPGNDVPFALLERYLAGEASAAEAATVRAWLAEDPEHARLLEDLRLIRRIAAERPPESDVDAAWARAVEELELHGPRNVIDTSRPVLPHPSRQSAGPAIAARRRGVRRLLPAPALAAAALVAALLAGGVIWQAHERSAPVSEELAWREYTTQRAQRANVRLNDGTQVVLAPDSRLRIAADFGATHRNVYLDGEAYVDVMHDATRPFRVHTGGRVAEALGTAFIVKAYPNETATEVVVTEGRVALWRAADAAGPRARTARSSAADPALVLAVGDLGRLDVAGRATVQHDVNVNRYLAWTTGVLTFDRTPFGNVVSTLERWYDIEIELADPKLAARPLTATFRSEPVAQVLDRVAMTLGLRVERSGRSFVLSRTQP